VPEASPSTDVVVGHAAWKSVVRLLRPLQWIKNGFVLAPLLFSGLFHEKEAVLQAATAALIFTIASCIVYVVNDLHDLPVDRRHPVKRLTRPLANGSLSPAAARVIAGFLTVILAAGVWLMPSIAVVVLAYVTLNLAYSARLKREPVVDLFCLAAGFVLRVFAGAVAISVPLSSWMLITTLCLALYLAAIKRREELSRVGIEGRSVLGSYTPGLLDRYALISASSSIVFYSLFVLEVRPRLVVTIPFVLFGLFRYWYIVESAGVGESPTDALWHDVPLAATVLGWVALCAMAL
jgi:4-hydroxybenzoate polyprenyltransferase